MLKKRNEHQLKKRKSLKHILIRKELSHKSFWAAFLVLFLVSALVILIQANSSITGHAIYHTISFVKAGTIIDSEVNVGGIKLANIYIKQDIQNSMITFEEDSSIPFEGIFYSKIKISSADAEKLEKLDLTLKIREQDLLDSGIGRNDVTLFINGKSVPTPLTKIDGSYISYTTSITEIGNVVIGKKIAAPAKIIPEPKAAEPEEVAVEPAQEVDSLPETEKIEEQPLLQPLSFWQKVSLFFRNLFS